MKIILHIFPNMFLEKIKREREGKKKMYMCFSFYCDSHFILKNLTFFYIEIHYFKSAFNFTSRNKIIFLHLSKILIV